MAVLYFNANALLQHPYQQSLAEKNFSDGGSPEVFWIEAKATKVGEWSGWKCQVRGGVCAFSNLLPFTSAI